MRVGEQSVFKDRTMQNFIKTSVSALVFFIVVLGSPMSDAEEGHIRKPLPSADAIAKLPKDGGKEFNRLIFRRVHTCCNMLATRWIGIRGVKKPSPRQKKKVNLSF